MTKQEIEDNLMSAESQRVRNLLLATPGAGPCCMPGCTVIHQGGIDGENAHLLTIHGIKRKSPRRMT